MLNYMLWGTYEAGDSFNTEEWFLVAHSSTPWGTDYIGYVHNSGSVISDIANIALPSANDAIASDGVFLIVVAGTSTLNFYEWDGATGFTLLNASATPDVVSSSTGILTNKDMAGKLLVAQTDTRSTSIMTYLSAAPYTVTQASELATAEFISGPPQDFRVGVAKYKPGYGTVFGFGTAVDNSERSQILTLSGTTLTVQAGSVDNQGWFSGEQNVGFDRDEHKVYKQNGTNVYVWDLTLESGYSIAARVNMALPSGRTCEAVTGCNGFIITIETGTPDAICCYSRSGSTLTLVDEITVTNTGASANASIVTSPYTNYVYAICGPTGRAYCLNVSNAGELSTIGTMPNLFNTSGGIKGFWAFLDAALP